MSYEIVLAPGAAADVKALSTPLRTGVKEAIERHLRHEPTKVGKSRIKRLRETQVQILAVVTKEQAQAWLDEQGTSEDDAKSGGAGGG